MATPIPRNQTRFTLGEIARATAGTLRDADAAFEIRGVSTDTRALDPGALFVALVGETHDGHDHLDKALASGAAAVLVRRGAGGSRARIEVDDTLRALGALARAHADRIRAKRAVPSVAITGSAGKTTTKELTAAVVRALFGSALVTQGNLNNLVGVPMTLFTLGDEHRAMVIECGTNARGEIARLGEIVAPDVGVVLNADVGHTAGLGTIEDVADEKGAMFRSARRIAIGNADDPVSRKRLERCDVERWLFGRGADATVRLLSRETNLDGSVRLRIELPQDRIEGANVIEPVLGLLGEAPAVDAAAALAGALALLDVSGKRRLSRPDVEAILAALSSVKPTPGRMVPVPTSRGLILDDTYNANPRSMRASIDTAAEVASSCGRLVLVLGDMLELGEMSAKAHASIGSHAVERGAAVLVTVGEQMALAARAAAASGGRAPLVVETARTSDAATVVEGVVREGDVVLVKGSRGMRMEAIVERLVGGTTRSAPA